MTVGKRDGLEIVIIRHWNSREM